MSKRRKDNLKKKYYEKLNHLEENRQKEKITKFKNLKTTKMYSL